MTLLLPFPKCIIFVLNPYLNSVAKFLFSLSIYSKLSSITVHNQDWFLPIFTMLEEQYMISLSLLIPLFSYYFCKPLKPRFWWLFETIQWIFQFVHYVWISFTKPDGMVIKILLEHHLGRHFLYSVVREANQDQLLMTTVPLLCLVCQLVQMFLCNQFHRFV